MSTWIELHADVFEHRKIVAVANALTHGDREKLVGHMARLWTWSLDHAQDGDLSHLSARDIARAAGWNGNGQRFVAALTEACLLDAGPRIHDWDDYARMLLERRRRDRERKKAEYAAKRLIARESGGASPGGSAHSPTESAQDVRVHRTEPNRTAPNSRYPRAPLVRTTVRPNGAVRYDVPSKRADGSIADSSGRVWTSMEQWAACVREQKTRSKTTER